MMEAMKRKLEYREEDVIHLIDGLVGLPDLKRWIIMEMDPPMPLKWLQSLDNREFRIPVTEPEYFLRDYGFDLEDKHVEALQNPTVEDLLVMIVTTVHPGGEKITGNMAAPIVFHTEKRLGVQCILDAKELSMRQEIDYVIFGVAVQSFTREKNAQAAISDVDSTEDSTYADKPKEALVQS